MKNRIIEREMERSAKHGTLRRLGFIEKAEIMRRFTLRSRGERAVILLRPLRETDREKIRGVLEDVNAFTPEEVSVAISLVDEALNGSTAYRFLVGVDEHDAVLGYICYGRVPMTAGTWDIYWIAVSKRFQGSHIGAMLIRGAEVDICSERGRLILIETSNKPSYRPTRRFYQRMGYHVNARIAQFYSEGDDKLIYSKYLRPEETEANIPIEPDFAPPFAPNGKAGKPFHESPREPPSLEDL